MTKILALIFVLCLAMGNTLGNFYFTYGIWPKSWLSFGFFSISHIIVFALLGSIQKELK